MPYVLIHTSFHSVFSVPAVPVASVALVSTYALIEHMKKQLNKE